MEARRSKILRILRDSFMFQFVVIRNEDEYVHFIY